LQNENVKVFTAVFDREVSDLSNFAKGLQRRAVPHTHTYIPNDTFHKLKHKSLHKKGIQTYRSISTSLFLKGKLYIKGHRQ